IAHEAGPALAGFLRARAGAPAWRDVAAVAGADLAPALAAFDASVQAALRDKVARRRARLRSLWSACFASHRLDALLHPAVRVTAPLLRTPRVSPAPQVHTRWGWMSAREAFAQNVTPASLAGAPS